MTAQNVGTRNCSGKGKDILPLGTTISIIWILSERTTVNWQTNLVGSALIISILNHEIVLRPILFSVYTVELYAIQLRDVSVTKKQSPVHPDDQLKFWDLLSVCLFLCLITLLQSQY